MAYFAPLKFMVGKTAIEYREVIATCKALFEKKTRDYGTAPVIHHGSDFHQGAADTQHSGKGGSKSQRPGERRIYWHHQLLRHSTDADPARRLPENGSAV